MKAADGQGRTSRQERIADTAGRPAEHPELVTRKSSRAEWKLLWPAGERQA